jgi:hypothetical protein
LSEFDAEEKIAKVVEREQSKLLPAYIMPIISPIFEGFEGRVSTAHPECRDVRPFTPPLSPFDRLGLNYNMSEGQQDPLESLTPEEANRIIHSHRKVRYGKPGAPHGRQFSVFIASSPAS